MKAGRCCRARISGLGLVTTLGDGVAANLTGLRRQEYADQRRTLNTSGGVVDVPYLSVGGPDDRPADQPVYQTAGDAGNSGTPFAPVGRAVELALTGVGCDSTDAQNRLRTMPVFVGSSSYAIGAAEALYAKALAGGGDALAVPLPGFSQVSRYLHAKHGFRGADFLFNTACTASANALLVAAEHVESGRCDQALVIGMELANMTTLAGFYGMQLLAGNRMRPFDLYRDGLVLGEGCGAIVLSAAQPGDEGLFIAGGASGCDTFSISTSNPDGTKIAATMRAALKNAAVEAADIAAIKAHGTASPLNDDAEAAGMQQVFASLPPFFALKSQLGHTLGACGVIETAIVAGSLLAGALPATGGFETFDEKLGVRPLTATIATGAGHYMLNFFGFGGNNASIILEHVRHDV